MWRIRPLLLGAALMIGLECESTRAEACQCWGERDRTEPPPRIDVEFEGYAFHACHLNLDGISPSECLPRFMGQAVWWFVVTRKIRGDVEPGQELIVHSADGSAGCGVNFAPCRIARVFAQSIGNHLFTHLCLYSGGRPDYSKVVRECVASYPPDHWEHAFLTCNDQAPSLQELCPPKEEPTVTTLLLPTTAESSSPLPKQTASRRSGGCAGCTLGAVHEPGAGALVLIAAAELLRRRRRTAER